MSSFVEEALKNREDVDTSLRFQRRKTFKSIFCTKLAKGIVFVLAVAIVIPTLTYFFVISRNVPDKQDDDTDQYYCLIREKFRIPCGNPDIGQEQCESLNCCFNSTTNRCHHYLPSKYFYKQNGDNTYYTSQQKSPVNSIALKTLKLTIQNKTANKLSLIIHDPLEKVDSVTCETPTNYSIVQSSKKLNLEIFDWEGDSIFSTAKGALIASERYWEWSFELTNGSLFGLDKNLITLKSNETLIKFIYKSRKDHFTLPVLWAYQKGKFHGIAIKHDGPLEIEILPSNIVILRSLIGKKIEVEISLGPAPKDLYRNQIEKSIVPPLWALGTHHCRKGKSTILKDILDIYRANNDYDFGTECIHENLFMALQSPNTTEDDIGQLKSLIADIAESGRKFLMSLPPQILADKNNELYTTIKSLDMLYKNGSSIYNGSYLSKKVVYPDFSDTNIDKYTDTLVKWLDSSLGLDSIAGFVLNDNWPQDDSFKEVPKNGLPYYTETINGQMQNTLPWFLEGTDRTLHLEKHNSYGELQNGSLYKSLNSQKRLIISSTKTFGNSEPEIGDNLATSWTNFNVYLNRMLFSSITGNPMVGLPICGDTDNYEEILHETLCIRWYIAASTMPYFRVSSGDIFRNPANFTSKFATKIVKEATNRRAMLQNYFLTLLKRSPPMVRPMYFDYYANETTLAMENQYTIGSDLIVAHPLSSKQTKLQTFLPSSKGVWYEFWGGGMFSIGQNNETVEIDSLETDWTMLIAQGSIVPLTRDNEIQLYIALNCTSESCRASGEIIMENQLLEIQASNVSATVTGLKENCNFSISYARIYGYDLSESGYILSYDLNEDLCGRSTETVTINFNDNNTN